MSQPTKPETTMNPWSLCWSIGGRTFGLFAIKAQTGSWALNGKDIPFISFRRCVYGHGFELFIGPWLLAIGWVR